MLKLTIESVTRFTIAVGACLVFLFSFHMASAVVKGEPAPNNGPEYTKVSDLQFVEYKGEKYTTSEFLSLDVRTPHYYATQESAASNFLYAFDSEQQVDKFIDLQQVSASG